MSIQASIEKEITGIQRVTILYLLLASAWVIFSDTFLGWFVSDMVLYSRLQTYKGWGFVIVTGSLLYFYLKPRTESLLTSQKVLLKTKEELRESEEKYRSLINGMTDKVWVIDFDGNIIDVNDSVVNALGYSREELLNMRPEDIDATLSPEEVSGLVGRMRTDLSQVFETTHVAKDGKTIPVEIKSSLVVYNGKQVVLSISRDITERKLAEEKAQYLLDLLKRTGEMAKVGGWEFDAEILEGTWTEEVARIHDMDPLDPTNVEKGIGFYTGASKQKITEATNAAINNAMPYDLELEMVTAKGNTKWVRTIGKPVIENCKVKKIIGSFQDITEYKQAEERENHLKKVLLGIRNVNQLITKENDPAQLIEKACQNLTETLGYYNAWIAVFDHDGAVISTAFSGCDDNLEAFSKQLEQGIFPVCMKNALGTRQITIISNTDESCSACPLAHEYSERAVMCYCLQYNNTLYGTLTVSVPLEYASLEEEQHLFREVADDLGFAFYKFEIEDKRRKVEEELKRRLDYELATVECMHLLLEPEDMDAILPGILVKLHHAVDNSRSYIFQNETDSELGLCMSQIYEVVGDGVTEQIDNPVLKRLPYSEGSSTLLATLQSEQYYAHLVEELNEPDRTILAEQGILSVLILPIFSGTEFWGFIGFDDCVNAREWHDDDIKLLRVVADGIGEAIHRKNAEEALKESEERFKSLHNASFGGIAIHDKGVILDCNLGLSEISGYTVEELIGVDGLLLIAEDYRDTVMKNILSGFEEPYEVMGLHKDGTEYPARLEAKNIPYKGKQVRVVEFRDITEQKNAEGSLRESEAKLNAMITNIADIIAIVDKDGINNFKSPNIERWFGWRPEEIIGVPAWKNIHPDDYVSTQKVFSTILEKPGAISTGESRYLCKNGSYKWIEFTGINLLHDPAIKGVLLNYRDITDRKKAEHSLIEAKMMAEENNRIKSEFLANMSHELRTPLTAVIGFSDILSTQKFGELNDKQVQFVDHILKSGKHLLEVINDVLDLSKVEAGKMELDCENFSVSKLLGEVQRSLYPLSLRKSIEIDIMDDVQDPGIFADKLKLKQIMYNLLSNAIKFTPDNGKVSVVARRADNILEVSVSDTGIGIPVQRLEEIFDPFMQVDASNKRRYGGTGLGLALAKRFVEMHDGKIWVESEEGKGSTFTFIIVDQGHDE
ncbi:sensory transduction histidine kinase [Methanolobus psychrophilus R15]|nr:sensory transduction histidine kinase [Methanolobus psychrophilus R15]